MGGTGQCPYEIGGDTYPPRLPHYLRPWLDIHPNKKVFNKGETDHVSVNKWTGAHVMYLCEGLRGKLSKQLLSDSIMPSIQRRASLLESCFQFDKRHDDISTN